MASAATVLSAANYHNLPPDQVVFGTTRKMQEIRERLEKLARTNMPVLIRGEIGTGKGIIAQLIHYRSPRNAGPFVHLTCSAIVGTTLEGELFGSEKGELTGPDGVKTGIIEQAVGGTLFLDEIGDLPPGLQAKLLQLLRAGRFSPMDDHSEVRLICATNRNLEDEIKSETVLADALYRFEVADIDLPPLRARKADVPELVEYFLDRYGKKFNRAVQTISSATMRKLEALPWRGNIRELENLVKRYVILGSENAIRKGLVPVFETLDRSEAEQFSLKRITKQASRELERRIILRVLENNRWNRRQTARDLKISYRALLYKLKEAGVTAAIDRKKKDGKQ